MQPSARSLRMHIEDLARKQPKKVALLSLDAEGNAVANITYGELPERLAKAAAYLASLGLKKGDRVSLAFSNSAELLLLSWAAWASGIVTVPMDTKRDTGEFYQYKMKLNGVRVLIAQQHALAKIDSSYLADVKVVEFAGVFNSDRRGDASPVQWESALEHVALILFTSGTTGHPKGARLSLKNLIVNADGIKKWLRIGTDDTFLVNLPLHHINSTTFCLSTLLGGGTIAIPPQYSNSHFWAQVAKSGATVTSIVQSILFDQLTREKEYREVGPHCKLTRIQIGSAPVLAQSVQDFRERYGIAVYQGYGQTETALRVTGVPMDVPEKLYEELVEGNSIGEPLAWADLRIADAEGKFLGESEEGELVVKGDAIMDAYVGGEKAFGDKGDAKGYFLTGDVGYYRTVNGRKFFYLKGRKREIIIKGGVNISPVAVENALKKISPEIEQAYAVSVEDQRYGEEIGAVVCWKAGSDVDAAKRRLKCALLFGTPHLSAYETPKYLTSFELKDLPMTSTGKVQRTVLKQSLPYERFESIFGLLKTPSVRYTVLHRYSRWMTPSWELYRHCWGELAGQREQYERNVQKHLIIMAAKPDDTLLGQIAVIRTDLSAAELLKTPYDELLSERVLAREGKSLVCISICSADYEPREVPMVARIPSADEVRAYVPQDPVFKFHAKPKGGLPNGASLVDVIPAGRPQDKSSLGYAMLVQYPSPVAPITVSESAPVSNRLIEIVLMLAHDLGIGNVYAYSRPGALASCAAKNTV